MTLSFPCIPISTSKFYVIRTIEVEVTIIQLLSLLGPETNNKSKHICSGQWTKPRSLRMGKKMNDIKILI